MNSIPNLFILLLTYFGYTHMTLLYQSLPVFSLETFFFLLAPRIFYTLFFYYLLGYIFLWHLYKYIYIGYKLTDQLDIFLLCVEGQHIFHQILFIFCRYETNKHLALQYQIREMLLVAFKNDRNLQLTYFLFHFHFKPFFN